jgi:hypothetical protein
MEGAKLIKNITLMGAFWAGFAMLVMNANAQSSIYEPETTVKTVTTSPGMNPGVVPQADIKAEAAKASVTGSEMGVANSGGTQVQNVTVQASPVSGAKAEASSSNTTNAYNNVDNMSKMRTDTEQAHNAMLLQQLELDRLKAEQGRLKAIEGFSTSSTHAAQPLVENININGSAIAPVRSGSSSVSLEVEDHSEAGVLGMEIGIAPVVGMRWFQNNMPNLLLPGATVAGVQAQNLYLVGVGLDGVVNPWLSVEGKFVYGKDSISGTIFSPALTGYRVFDRDSYEFSGGVKVGKFFTRFLKPYVALGLGYIHQTYDLSYQSSSFNSNTSNFEVNTGIGVDAKLSNNFSIGIRGDYQYLFGSNGDFYANGSNDNDARCAMSASAIWRF